MNVDYKIRKIIKWFEDNPGVYPVKSDNPELYTHISYIRNKAKKDLLNNSHLQMLKSINFEFNGQDRQWYSKFNKVREYAMLNNGQLPRMGNRKKLKEYDSKTGEWTDEKRKEEYLLGKWIMAQRTLIKNGKIIHYRKELLETIDMGIDGYKRKWDETFYALYNFVLEENRIPENKENESLHIWFHRYLKLYDNNELNNKQSALFTGLISLLKSDFRPRKLFPWDDRYVELEKFVNNNNRLPSSGFRAKRNNAEEFSLGQWLSNQKCDWRKNTLPLEKVLKLEKLGVVFKKIDHEKDWIEKFAKYCEFKKKFNREPKRSGQSDEEDKIADWVFYNRSLYNGAYKNRQIPEHRYKLLKSIDFPFEISNYERDRNWLENFNKYCEFKKQFNREPRITKKSDYERKIAIWMWYNRGLHQGVYKNRQLPERRYNLLKSMDFPFKQC